MKPKRNPKSFAGTVAQNLTRKKQVETMRHQLFKGCTKASRSQKEHLIVPITL